MVVEDDSVSGGHFRQVPGVVLCDEGESEIPVMRAVQCGERRC
jgi:hypothetical protein